MATQIHNTENKTLLLYHWVRILKELYPYAKTENPYTKEFESLSQQLTLNEKLLFHDVLHSITIINSQSRLNDDRELISTHADFINAIKMIMPKELILNFRALEAHAKMLTTFNKRPFTYQEAFKKLHIPKTTLRRYLKPLMLQNLVIKLDKTQSHKALFQAIEINTAHEEPLLSMFETMQGEWKDFVGFVEF